MAKQHYCFLERFNNYFNRKLIRRETLGDYENASQDSYIPTLANGSMTPFDFNPNDNITTEIIANGVPFDPDYFLLLDENAEIVSRWYVLEQKRNREGQWLYLLKRDVLADFLEEVADAPVYVEKGQIQDSNSPLLLNNEDLTVNQIKKFEKLLKDKTECAWLVMYLKKGVLKNGDHSSLTINIPNNPVEVYKTLNVPITSWEFYAYATSDYLINTTNKIEINAYLVNETLKDYVYQYNPNGNYYTWWYYSVHSGTNRQYNGTPNALLESLKAVLGNSASANSINSAIRTDFNMHDTNPLLEYEGKIIKDSNGKYYEVRRVYINSSGTNRVKLTSLVGASTKSTLDSYWTSATGQTAPSNDNSYEVVYGYEGYRIELIERKDIETTVDLSTYIGDGTTDSMLFDAICMPFGNVIIRDKPTPDQTFLVTTDSYRSLMVMSSIARQLTSQNVLDLQLLPYCPLQNIAKSPQLILTENYNDIAVFGTYGGNKTDVILVCPSANFSVDLSQHSLNPDDFISDYSKYEFSTYITKFLNDCTTLRVCSPNYNGLFEMNLAKNGNSIDGFVADITLRPYNPYIHVNPNFKLLYGRNFGDARGLICNGDFSLGIIDDAWQVYEIQNKNYQAIFDRQIQNMDINNKITMQESMWQAVAGTVTGAGAGATAGLMMGGGAGAIAGAVIGAGVSGIGGAMDISNLKERQREAISYATDNYNLSLGNIRALPNSITKTSALTLNNKIFPFVEGYCCTEVEELAYLNKLKYNGMKVAIIDKMRNYLSYQAYFYFRAKLIRLSDVSEDYHLVQAIDEELMKGVYI